MRFWTSGIIIIVAIAIAGMIALIFRPVRGTSGDASGAGESRGVESMKAGEPGTDSSNGGVSAAGGSEEVVKDVRLPIEYYNDGKIKTQFRAETAKIPAEGDIHAMKARLEFFTNNVMNGVVTVDECFYNRTNSFMRSDSPVRMEKDGVLITGNGMFWNVPDQNIRILDDVKVEFFRTIKSKRL